MRQIKFRAWHKNNKSMCQNVTTNLLDRDYLIFMQYTGLKDINGKEIYEGDIVVDEAENEIGKIYWNDTKSKFAYSVQLTDGSFDEFEDYLNDLVGSFRIEGNIYENPELIQ